MAANKMKAALAPLAAAAVLAGGARAEGPDIKMSPLHVGAAQEFGLFERGLFFKEEEVKVYKDEWTDHFGAWFVQEALVNDRLAIKAGLGGFFMFPKPEAPDEEFGGSQFKAFYVGPAIAEAMYHFGGAENSVFSLGGGMFPYKYNPDASNLGEYLFRSIPYPTILQTGGLTAIGGNAEVLQGFRGSLRLGGLSADALLFTETTLPPLYNWSAALVAGYSIADGLIEVGAGVNVRHLIQVRPKRSAKRSAGNTEFQVGGKWYAGDERYYSLPAQFLDNQIQANINDGNAANDADTVPLAARRDALNRDAFRVKTPVAGGGWLQPNGHDWIDSTRGGATAEEQHYSSSGILAMGRVSLDLKKLVPSDRHSAADFRIYAEAAVLGLKNYNIYYQKISERMPIMLGVNIPTWGVLDLFAVQVEQFKSPNLNNYLNVGSKNFNTPFLPESGDKVHSEKGYNDLTTKDDYAWSILMQKKLMGVFTLSAQIARDHHRSFANVWFFGKRFDPPEITHKGPGYFDFDGSSWYWMMQLGWNI